MKYPIFIFLFSFGFYHICLSQTNCGTERIDSLNSVTQPYFGNNQFLLDLVNQVESSSGCVAPCNAYKSFQGGISQAKYHIPVKAWIYRETNGTNLLNFGIQDVERLINLVNGYFERNGVSIRFYVKCNFEFVNDTDYYRNINCSRPFLGDCTGSTNMMLARRDNNALNIHFILNNNDDFGGRARFPWGSSPYSFAQVTAFRSTNTRIDDETIAGIMAHEIGHTLGLLHTFENARGIINQNNGFATGCYQEYVDRNSTLNFFNGCFGVDGKKRCEVNGDMLCDTDADPQTNLAVTLTDNCTNFIRLSTSGAYFQDNSGTPWFSNGRDNALRNIMSYATPPICSQQFTTMQRGLMYNYVQKYRTPWYYIGDNLILPQNVTNPNHFHTNLAVDIYENDNYWRIGNNFNQLNNRIDVNSRQYHSFHTVHISETASQSCDTDWLYFEVTTAGTYILKTSAVTNQPNANTELILYSLNASGNPSEITRHDNISGTNLYSRIQRNLAVGFYAIQVVNKANAVGHYFLELACIEGITYAEMIGSNSVCHSTTNTNTVYTLQNLPAGVTVSWSASPASLFAVSSGTGISFATRAASATNKGQGVITATLQTACGALELKKDVKVSSPPITVNFYTGSPNNPGVNDSYLLCRYSRILFGVDFNDPEHTFQWAVQGGTIDYGQGTNSINAIYTDPSGVVELRIFDRCAKQVAIFVYYFTLDECGGGGGGPMMLSVSPNPTSDELNLDLVDNPDNQALSQDSDFEIKLFNAYGESVYTQKTKLKKLKIDTRTLGKGLYYLQVIHPQGIETQRIVIEK